MDTIETITQKNSLSSARIFELKIAGHPESHELSTKMVNVQPKINIDDLEIFGFNDFTIMDDTFMLYIMKKFPNVQHFSIRSDDDAETSRVMNQTTISVDVSVQFLNYLSKIPRCIVNSIVTEEKTAEIIKKLCSSTNDKETLFKHPCLSIRYRNDISDEEEATLRNPVVDVDSDTWWHTYFGHRTIIVTFNRRFNNAQKERKLIAEAGQFFTKLFLRFVPDLIYGTILENIARNCANLKELEIRECPRIPETFKYRNLTANHSLTNLKLSSCELSTKLFSVISDVFPNLKDVFIYHGAEKYGPKRSLLVSMPNVSIDCFKLKIQFFNFTISRQTITGDQGAIGLCIKLHIGKDFKYLYFAFQAVEKSLIYLSNNPLQFVKELTSAEYEEMEDSFQHYMPHILQITEKVFIGV